MILKNLSEKTEVCEDLKVVSKFTDALFGLLHTDNTALLFYTRFGIHTFFLKKSIDIIILDHDFKVVKIGNVAPNRLFFWHPIFNIVIELPNGIIQKSRTKLGDKLIIATKKPSSF